MKYNLILYLSFVFTQTFSQKIEIKECNVSINSPSSDFNRYEYLKFAGARIFNDKDSLKITIYDFRDMKLGGIQKYIDGIQAQYSEIIADKKNILFEKKYDVKGYRVKIYKIITPKKPNIVDWTLLYGDEKDVFHISAEYEKKLDKKLHKKYLQSLLSFRYPAK
jgi:hypothetical protein